MICNKPLNLRGTIQENAWTSPGLLIFNNAFRNRQKRNQLIGSLQTWYSQVALDMVRVGSSDFGDIYEIRQLVAQQAK